MSKSIYCVKHEWFDRNCHKLPKLIVTHTWHTSYRKAEKEFEHRLRILYANYDERHVERAAPNLEFCPDDGSYEISAARVYATFDKPDHIRVSLCAVDLR